jgi:hypothetical protein
VVVLEGEIDWEIEGQAEVVRARAGDLVFAPAHHFHHIRPTGTGPTIARDHAARRSIARARAGAAHDGAGSRPDGGRSDSGSAGWLTAPPGGREVRTAAQRPCRAN